MTRYPDFPSYPPPAASQPAIEGAQSGGRPWITLRRASIQRSETSFGIGRSRLKT